jgi:ATP-dependent helicase/nuclease subunit A
MRSPRPAGTPDPAADPASSVWVGASAGTGKTKILTDRVLALLLGNCHPGRILCLTFTRAAAAEMAIRLNDRLSQWATEPDGMLTEELAALLGRMPDEDDINTARRLFARVLDVPGGMKIETIHAFCQSLLRRFPLEARIAPHFEVMDERNAAEALVAARDATLDEARRDADPALATITRYAGEERFDGLMAALIAERARLARALDGGADDVRDRLCRALDVAPDATPDGIIAAACAGGDFGLAAAVRLMAASVAKTDRARGVIIADFLASSDRPALFEDYAGVFFTQKGEDRQRIATVAVTRTSPESEVALRQEAARLRGVLRARAAVSLRDATLALATLGGRMLARYARHKEQRALLDYDDLVLLAGDLLRRPGVAPWVLYKLDGGLDHILIDEAQDTNQEQWDVVAALAEEFFAGLSARTLVRTVFAVGDPKQSIFSFQRADPVAFARMRRGRRGLARRAAHRLVSFRAGGSRRGRWRVRPARRARRAGARRCADPPCPCPRRGGRLGRTVAGGRAARCAESGAVGAAGRAASPARAADAARARHCRDHCRLAGAGRAACRARSPHPGRRRDGAGAAAQAVRRRDGACAQGSRRRGRRRRPDAPHRSARHRGHDGGAAVRAVAGGRSDTGDGAEGAAGRVR